MPSSAQLISMSYGGRVRREPAERERGDREPTISASFEPIPPATGPAKMPTATIPIVAGSR